MFARAKSSLLTATMFSIALSLNPARATDEPEKAANDGDTGSAVTEIKPATNDMSAMRQGSMVVSALNQEAAILAAEANKRQQIVALETAKTAELVQKNAQIQAILEMRTLTVKNGIRIENGKIIENFPSATPVATNPKHVEEPQPSTKKAPVSRFEPPTVREVYGVGDEVYALLQFPDGRLQQARAGQNIFGLGVVKSVNLTNVEVTRDNGVVLLLTMQGK